MSQWELFQSEFYSSLRQMISTSPKIFWNELEKNLELIIGNGLVPLSRTQHNMTISSSHPYQTDQNIDYFWINPGASAVRPVSYLVSTSEAISRLDGVASILYQQNFCKVSAETKKVLISISIVNLSKITIIFRSNHSMVLHIVIWLVLLDMLTVFHFRSIIWIWILFPI